MRELSLHILDIAQNSIRAEATRIEIIVKEMPSRNLLEITVEDNGKGMDEQVKNTVTNPFTTTRTLRKVGLGLPLLDQLCKECEGDLQIESERGCGTKIVASMQYNHIDRLPLGQIETTLTSLIMAKPEIHYIYTHHYEEEAFQLDTEAIQSILDGVPIQDLEILKWLENYIREQIEVLK